MQLNRAFLVLCLSALVLVAFSQDPQVDGGSKSTAPTNQFTLSIGSAATDSVLSLDEFPLFFNEYHLSTFNDPGNAHLSGDTVKTSVVKLVYGEEPVEKKDTYVEVWWQVYVDTSMAHRMIGFNFAPGLLTNIYWDEHKVIGLGHIDADHGVIEPANVAGSDYPIYTGDPGIHDLVIRQKFGDNLIFASRRMTVGMHYAIYRDHADRVAVGLKEQLGFTQVFLYQGFRFFLLGVFVVSALFYLIVDRSRSFLWFSAFSFSAILLLFMNLLFTSRVLAYTVPVLLFFSLFSFLAFVSHAFIGKVPRRVHVYFILALITGSYAMFNAYTIHAYEISWLASLVDYAGFIIIAVIAVEILVQIVRAIRLGRRRVQFLAFGVAQLFVLLLVSLAMPDDDAEVLFTISIFVLPITFLITLIYIVKDSFTTNIKKQAEVIHLTQANQQILEEQNVTLEKQVQVRTQEVVRQKQRSDELLLNILPADVAEELKDTGTAAAKLFDRATILFTDFKGFTEASEQMSPQMLVEELNSCFMEFDQIITERGIEKIKTIGDAYMCVGGLPDPQSAAPVDVVHAALEMQRFMEQRKVERDAQGLPVFEMRVGIHTGPVVAGIVGVKKFQYDIWGDTVNIASRMESSGAVGKVNISEATYALVKDERGLRFTSRGKVQAKGKGVMEMYFAEQVL